MVTITYLDEYSVEAEVVSVGVLEAGLIHGVVTATNLDEYSVEAEVVPDGVLEACLIHGVVTTSTTNLDEYSV